MPLHAHADFHELIVVIGGTIETTIRATRITGRRGDVLYYPLGEWHSERALSQEPLETLFLAWRWRAGEPSADWPLLVNDGSGRIQMLAHWIGDLFPAASADQAHMGNVLLDALLYEMETVGQARDQDLVMRTRAFMQHHLGEPLTLDDIAAHAGLSKYHFCRRFKHTTGVSPMQYLRQLRVEAARSLLLSTPWTLKAVAQQVGFSDEFQLSRVFRRMTGVPPSQVRHGGT